MKLVERLARELPEWPGELVLVQGCSGLVYEAGGQGMSVEHFDIASDWRLAEVTRAQWEAERARILAESQPDRDEFIKELVDAACGKRSQYEQELWDKVAASVYQMAFVEGLTGWDIAGFEYESGRAFLAADAFMAERAKRMKQGANHE